MKALILFLMLPATASRAHLSNQPLPPLPNSLSCDGVMAIYGDPSFSDLSFFRGIKLTHLNHEPTWQGAIGEIRHELSDDKVTIDFSNGDQYSSFMFRKDDLRAINQGTIKRLSGIYEDGYDWADGFHTRAAILVHCISD